MTDQVCAACVSFGLTSRGAPGCCCTLYEPSQLQRDTSLRQPGYHLRGQVAAASFFEGSTQREADAAPEQSHGVHAQDKQPTQFYVLSGPTISECET